MEIDRSILIICHRMIYVYHISLDELVDEYEPIKTKDLPKDPGEIRKIIDHAINNINYNSLPESLKQIWQEDKFQYVTWVRDELMEIEIKSLLDEC